MPKGIKKEKKNKEDKDEQDKIPRDNEMGSYIYENIPEYLKNKNLKILQG